MTSFSYLFFGSLFSVRYSRVRFIELPLLILWVGVCFCSLRVSFLSRESLGGVGGRVSSLTSW